MLRRISNQSASKPNAAAVSASPYLDKCPPDADIHDSQDTAARPDVGVDLPQRAAGATTNIVDGTPTADAASSGCAGTFEPREGYDDGDDGFISNGNEFPVVPIGNLTGHLTPELLSTLREEVRFFESSAGPIAAIDIKVNSDKRYTLALHFVSSVPISREEIPLELERARDHLRRIAGNEDIPAMTRALVEHSIELLWCASDTLSPAAKPDEGELCKLVSDIHLALKQLPISEAGQQERIVQKLLSARDAVRAVPERRRSAIEDLARVLPEVAGCTSILSEEDIAAVLDAPDRKSLTKPVNDVLHRFSLKRAAETARKLIDKCRVKRSSNSPA